MKLGVSKVIFLSKCSLAVFLPSSVPPPNQLGGGNYLETSPVAIFSLKISEIFKYETIMGLEEDNYFVNKFSYKSLLGS
ncbi:MAG: hypothetical protein EA362_00070 [Saprospirales bacterium]|nr:MAG: hypothetical protein EA362_00070 [Saprospirales bacterium]